MDLKAKKEELLKIIRSNKDLKPVSVCKHFDTCSHFTCNHKDEICKVIRALIEYRWYFGEDDLLNQLL